MKKLLLVCLAPALIYAQGLKELLENAHTNNSMVASMKLSEGSRQKDLEASQNSYYPTVDIGSGYQTLNVKSPNTPGDVYSGFVRVGVDLYDGGYKSNTIKSNESLLKAAKLQTSSYTKSLELSVVEDFYNIKNTQSTLKALKEKKTQLEAELSRIEQFYSVGSATKDEIDKLQAELSNNMYSIETTKYQLLSLKKLLSIKVGIQIDTLDNSLIQVPKFGESEMSDEIQAMQESANSYEFVAKSIDASYKPTFRLEDTFSVYDYGRTDASHPEGLDNQNQLVLSFSMRLYDNGAVKNQKDSVLLQKRALQKEIEQVKETQDINIKLAMSKIETAKAQIQSAKKSLESANSAYETILEKYKVGVVDNIAYLDALSTKTNAMAQYDRAQNDLQVAYAAYYYYANKNIKEYVQ